jgi:hypothetical protein
MYKFLLSRQWQWQKIPQTAWWCMLHLLGYGRTSEKIGAIPSKMHSLSGLLTWWWTVQITSLRFICMNILINYLWNIYELKNSEANHLSMMIWCLTSSFCIISHTSPIGMHVKLPMFSLKLDISVDIKRMFAVYFILLIKVSRWPICSLCNEYIFIMLLW